MKSSTIRRSTLSRETMEVIENLAKDNDTAGLPGEYVRPQEIEEAIASENASSKSQEIDLLWQTFKTSQFNTNSPIAHVSLGFVSGVAVTLIVLACFGAFSMKSDDATNMPKKSIFGIHNIFAKKQAEPTLEQQTETAENTVDAKVNIPTEADNQAPTEVQEAQQEVPTAEINLKNAKKYIVKDGDTGESIIKHFYGAYTPERAERIIKANNLTTLDRINIDQELIIPVE